MKDYGVIDGHRFSRSTLMEFKRDLDKAIVEMNKPDPIKHLTQVRLRGTGPLHTGHSTNAVTGVVLIGELQKRYSSTLGSLLDGEITVVDIYGHGHTFKSVEHLRASWEVMQ